MSTSVSSLDAFPQAPDCQHGRAPGPPEEDDGIHIESVTRVERPEGPYLRPVVVWMEDGRWVGTVLEIPEKPETGAPAFGPIRDRATERRPP